MSSTFEVMYDNWFDSATLYSGSADSAFPLANVQDIWHTKVHRTTGKSSEWWKWDLGSARAVSRLVFKTHNWSSGATIKVYGHASDLGTNPSTWNSSASFTQAITWRASQISKALSAAQTYQWWFLWVQDSGNSASYLSLGRAYGGAYFSPRYSYSGGFRWKPVDPSVIDESIGGQISVVLRQRYRTFGYQFLDMYSTDVVTMDDIYFTYLGKGTPFFICTDTTDRDTNTLYVENTEDWEFTNSTADGRADVTMSLRMSR